MRVLLVEDDEILGEAVRDHMALASHAIDWMRTLEDARAAIETTQYSMVLLDLRLPDGSGIDLLKSFRTKGNLTPVIILTAHDQISDRIEGLNSGADDYIVKPFDLGELSARVQAIARRMSGRARAALLLGDLEIDTSGRTIRQNGQEILLSGREWAVLDTLLSRQGTVVSKARIEEALYAFGSEIESNTVEVYISRLRKKLGKDAVQTVRGVGYRAGDHDGQ